MKKVLFTIMAAVVLMSCGGSANDPEISANDKKAMKKASCDAVAQLGENKCSVVHPTETRVFSFSLMP